MSGKAVLHVSASFPLYLYLPSEFLSVSSKEINKKKNLNTFKNLLESMMINYVKMLIAVQSIENSPPNPNYSTVSAERQRHFISFTLILNACLLNCVDMICYTS